MKKLFKALWISGIIITILLVLIVKTTIFDHSIKYIVVYAARIYGYKISISSLSKDISIKNSTIELHNINYDIYKNYSININSIRININFIDFLIPNRLITIHAVLDKVKLYSTFNDTPLINVSFDADYAHSTQSHDRKYIGTINIRNIESGILNLTDSRFSNLVKTNICNFEVDSNNSLITNSCKFYGRSKSLILDINVATKFLNGVLTQCNGTVESQSLPLIISKKFSFLFPNNNIWKKVTNLIEHGQITNARISFDLGNEFFNNGIIEDHNLYGQMTISNTSIKYDVIPRITDIKSNVQILGSKLYFTNLTARLLETSITETQIHLDWKKFLNTKIYITGKANGCVHDLITGFIPTEFIDKMRSAEINLADAYGTAATKFNIVIPIAAEFKNKYSVKTQVSNFHLKLKEKFKLFYELMEVGYDGHTVMIVANGKINNMNCNLNYKALVDTENKFCDALNLALLVNNQSNFNADFLQIIGGSAIVNLKIQSKSNYSTISIDDDLTNLGFTIYDNLVTKNAGQKARLHILTKFSNSDSYQLSVQLHGSNNLNIQGIINYDNKTAKFNFPVFQYANNDLIVKVNLIDDQIITKIKGNILDLSDINLKDLIGHRPFQSFNNSNTIVDVNKVALKDNIILTDFYLTLNQNNNLTGQLLAKIGGQNLIAELTTADNYTKLELTTPNASNLIQELKISKDIIKGELILQLNIPHNLQEKITGNLIMKNFTTKRTSFLTRLVSLFSIHGLINFVTLQDTVYFSNMYTKFDYDKGVIQIHEGKATGSSLSFTLYGIIDTNERYYNIVGKCYPVLYGINPILKNIVSARYNQNSRF
ncbi:hypothetical protein OCHUTO_0049 [Orientia chuto str. Dubai]|uniref:AsmA-like C-terminal region family protein n=1 Tax=Orientia chuto str. Dubai TaxID=1359168 RepID=A0A0F3MPU6_9RICK|nr:hypothetical protein [Candidatus Orientia mediorientalis]KJV57487.1 hypothetical protein OCHUTO_0049 [Orientia chuto str. Dubai]